MPIRVIFDTDIWSDIDDALALAMLHALEDRGESTLLAVTISTNNHSCASYVNLLNTFYGRPHIPIGIVRNGIELASIRKKLPETFLPVTRYTEHLSEQKNQCGDWIHPHQVTSSSTIPEATALLRKTLEAQPDNSVVIIEVGYSTNLARLLTSTPDAFSALNGRQLIAKKVRQLVIMAGSFRRATANGEMLAKQEPEFNLMVDIPSAQALFANWPTHVVASGVEIGLALPYPPDSIRHDYAYAQDHPIAQTYRLFCEERQARHRSINCPHAHPTFDLTAVLFAARPDRNYFSLSDRGQITILDDGSSHFQESPEGRDQHLILTEEQKTRTLEAMVMLTSQPPRVSR